MFIKIIGIFAEFERENIGERVRLGKERKAREGFTTASYFTSYGYEIEKGEKVQRIKESEAAIVRRIFDLYANQNTPLNAIARILNTEKIPSKLNSKWSATSVKSLLQNSNYAGYVRYGVKQPDRFFEAEGNHEPIISEELFTKAQTVMKQNGKAAPTKRGLEPNYFLGMLNCSLCGTRLRPHMAVRKDGTTEHHFVCSAREHGACDSKMVSAMKFERTLIAYFAAIPAAVPDAAQAAQEAEAKKAAAAQVKALRKKIAAIDAKEQEILESYIEDNASLAEYRGVKVTLDAQRAKLTEEIERLTPNKAEECTDTMTREQVIKTFRVKWPKFTHAEKRQFLLAHIRKISVVNRPVEGRITGHCEITAIEFNGE
jgi:site-specific DNA recombinase